MNNYRVRINDFLEGNEGDTSGIRFDGPVYHDLGAALQHAFDLALHAVYNAACGESYVSSNCLQISNGNVRGFCLTLSSGIPDEPGIVHQFDIVEVDYNFVV